MIQIDLEPDEAHPHPRSYKSERFLTFWRDQFGTIRFVAVPPDDGEWADIMDGIEAGNVGVFDEDEADPE